MGVSGSVKAVRARQGDSLRSADLRGHPAEFSGFYGAKAGRRSLSSDLARNDTPGVWIIRVRELASGQSTERNLTVIGP